MANIAQQRIQREFREVVKSKEIAESGVQLELVADDLTELAGTVAGPPDTPYSGGKFKLEIKIPDTYPFNPPKVVVDLVQYCPVTLMLLYRFGSSLKSGTQISPA